MDTVNSIIFLVFCGITTIALLIVLNLLLPGKVERAREKLETQPVRCLVIGLVALCLSLAVLLLLGYLINLPILQTMAQDNVSYLFAFPGLARVILTLVIILLGLGLLSLSAIGLAALAGLGQRIEKTNPSSSSRLPGVMLLVLSCLVPILGWFIITPVALFIGFGSTIQTFFKHNANPKVVEYIFPIREKGETSMMNTISILYILLGGITIIAMLGTFDLFFPKPVTRARQKLESAPGKSFLVGLVNVIFWLVVLVLWFEWTQANGGPDMMPYLIGTILVILLIIGLIIPGIPGLAALAGLTGQRWNAYSSPLGQNLRGGLLLVLSCLTPYVGWFIFTPALLCTAIGAGLLTFFQREKKTLVVKDSLTDVGHA